MFEGCVEIRSYFSDYLDDMCEPETLRSIRFHLAYCGACQDELERWQAMKTRLRALPRRRVPPELGLRLRVRLSHQLHRNLLMQLGVRLENALRPLLLPASGGVVAAVICFGVFMGMQVLPATNAPDVPLQLLAPLHAPASLQGTPLPPTPVPLQLSTPPRVRRLAPMEFSAGDDPVVVVTMIDAGGRAMGYQVLSGPSSPQLIQRLERMIFFSTFQPATAFGRPTDGQVVLSLQRITVRG